MIKRITLKNFESHEDSKIEFSDGLNLIIGQSNQGKSSIVRALAMVVANRFDHDSVRTGTEYCSVKVETEKGSVTTERGEDTNHWIVETPKYRKEYRNIGLSVPPEVLEILGMGERVRGEIKELPNIMFQLEKHYMLSEIDGKKTTANAIARMMDEAIGIGGMEELIKDIATDFASKKKELSSKNILISELRSRILDIDIFEDYKKSIEESRAVFEEVDSLNDLHESAKELSSKVESNKSERQYLESELECSEGIEELSDNMEILARKFKLLSRVLRVINNIKDVKSRLSKSDGLEEIFDSTQTLIQKQIAFQKVQTEAKRIETLNDRIGVDSDFDTDLGSINKKKDSITTAVEMLRNAREYYKKIRNISSSIINQEKELKEKEKTFSSLKEQLGQCPLCGGKL